MKAKRIILIISAVLVLVAVALWVLGGPGWQSIAVQFDSESLLRISRKQSHPYLAEYQREVTVFRSGKRLATLSYPDDSGGGFPIQVRFYADGTRRVVRMTDGLYDRLIDLRTRQFVADETPPDGKESTSFIRVAELPPLQRSVEIGYSMEVILR